MSIPSSILEHHDRVARQHALFVRLLPEPLFDWTVGYYLLFRMIDTVEDAIADPARAAEILANVSRDPFSGLEKAAPEVEHSPVTLPAHRSLFARAPEIRAFLKSIDPAALDRILATARVMSAGMSRHALAFQGARDAGETRYLADMNELDDYCHAVAGCVGILSTRLFILSGFIGEGRGGELEPLGDEFGRYLQAVNILRDHADDLRERNRSHIPRSIEGDSAAQADALIAFARSKETACRDYLAALPKGPVLSYCGTLFRVARLHLRHFSHDPLVLDRRSRVPTWRLLAALPPALQFRFLLHKLSPVRTS